MPVNRRVWACPGCQRRFRIPADRPDPHLCPGCSESESILPERSPLTLREKLLIAALAVLTAGLAIVMVTLTIRSFSRTDEMQRLAGIEKRIEVLERSGKTSDPVRASETQRVVDQSEWLLSDGTLNDWLDADDTTRAAVGLRYSIQHHPELGRVGDRRHLYMAHFYRKGIDECCEELGAVKTDKVLEWLDLLRKLDAPAAIERANTQAEQTGADGR